MRQKVALEVENLNVNCTINYACRYAGIGVLIRKDLVEGLEQKGDMG
jgi:hypothetical protein